jgi:hypothetical protein
MHRVSGVRQIQIHTAELLLRQPSLSDVEIAIAKLKNCKSPGSDQITAELIQAGSETLSSEIRKPINSFWKKEKLPEQKKESIIVQIYKKSDKTDCNDY